MVKNFKLIIEYDGSRYHGWQRQKNDPSIQGEIEKALKTMTAKKVKLISSGRTDTGVHAEAQVANFECDTRLKPEALMNGLNSILAEDIKITICEQMNASFHARYDAKSKIYHYKILNRPTPAAIGRGITVACANAQVSDAQKKLCDSLLQAAGVASRPRQRARAGACAACGARVAPARPCLPRPAQGNAPLRPDRKKTARI